MSEGSRGRKLMVKDARGRIVFGDGRKSMGVKKRE